MSQAELELIMDQTHRLKGLQEQPDSPDVLAMLPGLKLEDLEKEIKRVPIQVDRSDVCEILYHNIFTNGILYLDLGFDLHTLPQDLLPYVNLFGRALMEMGTEREDFVRLSQRIGSATGGIWSDVFTSMIRDKDKGAARLFLRSKATMVQAQDLLNILLDILLYRPSGSAGPVSPNRPGGEGERGISACTGRASNRELSPASHVQRGGLGERKD